MKKIHSKQSQFLKNGTSTNMRTIHHGLENYVVYNITTIQWPSTPRVAATKYHHATQNICNATCNVNVSNTYPAFNRPDQHALKITNNVYLQQRLILNAKTNTAA